MSEVMGEVVKSDSDLTLKLVPCDREDGQHSVSSINNSTFNDGSLMLEEKDSNFRGDASLMKAPDHLEKCTDEISSCISKCEDDTASNMLDDSIIKSSCGENNAESDKDKGALSSESSTIRRKKVYQTVKRSFVSDLLISTVNEKLPPRKARMAALGVNLEMSLESSMEKEDPQSEANGQADCTSREEFNVFRKESSTRKKKLGRPRKCNHWNFSVSTKPDFTSDVKSTEKQSADNISRITEDICQNSGKGSSGSNISSENEERKMHPLEAMHERKKVGRPRKLDPERNNVSGSCTQPKRKVGRSQKRDCQAEAEESQKRKTKKSLKVPRMHRKNALAYKLRHCEDTETMRASQRQYYQQENLSRHGNSLNNIRLKILCKQLDEKEENATGNDSLNTESIGDIESGGPHQTKMFGSHPRLSSKQSKKFRLQDLLSKMSKGKKPQSKSDRKVKKTEIQMDIDGHNVDSLPVVRKEIGYGSKSGDEICKAVWDESHLDSLGSFEDGIRLHAPSEVSYTSTVLPNPSPHPVSLFFHKPNALVNCDFSHSCCWRNTVKKVDASTQWEENYTSAVRETFEQSYSSPGQAKTLAFHSYSMNGVPRRKVGRPRKSKPHTIPPNLYWQSTQQNSPRSSDSSMNPLFLNSSETQCLQNVQVLYDTPVSSGTPAYASSSVYNQPSLQNLNMNLLSHQPHLNTLGQAVLINPMFDSQLIASDNRGGVYARPATTFTSDK